MSSTRRQRAGLRGVGKLRRTLRRLEPEATRELREAVDDGSEAMLQDMVDLVGKRSGNLARALQRKVARDGLTAKVGLTTRKRQDDFFYARFLEYGTKGSPEHNIPPMEAQPFMGPSFDLNRDYILQRAQTGIRIALRRASGGGHG